MDLDIYKSLNEFAADHDVFEDVLRFFALNGQFFFLALLAGLFLGVGRWRSVSGRRAVAAAGFSALLALGAGQVISHLWERPRPYIAHPNVSHLFIAPSHDPSFPSDHATAAFAIAVAIWLRHRRAGWLALGLGTIVSVSRVVVGTHYPSDVVGGAIIGTLAALVFWQPWIRNRVHGLADWAGRTYERLITGYRTRTNGDDLGGAKQSRWPPPLHQQHRLNRRAR
jgi:undecaprenyl-diphosphatase